PVFVFPGQGSQWTGMAVELLATSPVFRTSMDTCAEALSPFTDWNLLDVLHGTDEELANRVDVIQPTLWAIMISLAAVWRACGTEPAAVIGHSQGEIAAAVVAGALTLHDGAQIVALRSKIIKNHLAGKGGMASVAMTSHNLRERLTPWQGRLSLAAVNGPTSSVVCGHTDALDDLLTTLQHDDIRARRIPVDYASHSVFVEETETQLLHTLKNITPQPASIPFYSTVTGGLLDTTTLDTHYWYRNLRQTVRFEETIRELTRRGHDAYIEISPHPVLTTGIQETLDTTDTRATICTTLRRNDGGPQRLLTSLAHAWTNGITINWSQLTPTTNTTPLPTYAFQHQRYWLDTT
ncbi:acyltransferase domain-containing protein, partial [Streptomyces sp. NPDC057694]|uniref:acyltransferase domain-containing protein n=1 Tax=Streptomyces sp. NPDC057694 TaxID=3346216 RepID=UPI0036AC6F02